LSREVLTQQDYQLSPSGYVLDNSVWQEEIQRRLEEERKKSPIQSWPLGEGTVQVQSFELGSFEESLSPVVLPETVTEPTQEEVKARILAEAETEAQKIKETARKSALEITEQAHWEVQEILTKAREEAEKESVSLKEESKVSARLEGLELGRLEGFQKGKEEGSKAFDGALQKWERMAQQLLIDRHNVLSDMKSLLAELLEQALMRCLQKEAKRHKQMAVDFAEEAIKKAHDRVLLKLHVNPADLEEFEANRERLQLTVGSGPLELVADARIEQGGCLLETEAGSIDARLGTIASQVKESLDLGLTAPKG
jgi:flagellar assembly protein FliH